MAKQKLRMPSFDTDSRPEVADTRKAAPAQKRRAKNAGKVKAKSVVEGATAAGAVPSREVKIKRKPQRAKSLPRKVAARAAQLVSRLTGTEGGSLVRPKKIRLGAPLGRLERLELAIGEVRVGGRTSPRTRKLLSSGVHKMAQKVIEEAAEAAIEAIRGDHAAFVNESVDLFYNLLVLGSELGVPLSAIWTEMDRREQTLGMAEKLPKGPES